MEQGVILQVLVLGLCSSVGHGASLDACMMVLLSEEFHTTCSTLGKNHTRPCLVQAEKDVTTLKRAKVVGDKMLIAKNKICAARIEEGETDCVSVHLQCNQQQNWQWTEWAGTSPNIARRFTVTEGSTNRLCPYVDRYFKPEALRDCLDAYTKGFHTSGVYSITPDGSTEVVVYCDQELQGGGWTLIQRRQDGSVNFKRTWAEYEAGFGDLNGEHWLGNHYIHLLTKAMDQQVLFRLQNAAGEWALAPYSRFWIEDASEKFRLHIGGYYGTSVPGNSMECDGKLFTTKDQDNDAFTDNCAVRFHGGWWYGSCHHCNPNGDYGNTGFGEGINWQRWGGLAHSMSYTAIMVRTNND